VYRHSSCIKPSLTTSFVFARWIASLQGATTHSQSDRIVTARYSAFLFITQFFIFSLLGVAVQVGRPFVRRAGIGVRLLILVLLPAMKLYVEIDGNADASEIWDYIKTIPDTL
jgi:hypothetical protein